MSSDDSSLIEKLCAQLAASEAEEETTLVAQLAEKDRLLSLAPARSLSAHLLLSPRPDLRRETAGKR